MYIIGRDHDLAVLDDGAVLDRVHAEDRRLRRVDDRRGHQRAEGAAVGDGEGAALQLFDAQPPSRAFLAKSGDRLLRCRQSSSGFGVAQHRRDQARRWPTAIEMSA
jgi:hypothetical protein